MQASIHTSLGNSAMSDVPTTDAVSFQPKVRSVVSNGGDADLGRLDANTSLFGAGGYEYVLANIEVKELSERSRKTRRMAQDELSAMEQNALSCHVSSTPTVPTCCL